MRFTVVVECCRETGMYVGYVPGFTGARYQAESLDELKWNLSEIPVMILEYDEQYLDA